MKLTILGSGSPEPCKRRASSGYLLEIGKDLILFDCGGGVFDNLIEVGHKPSDITHIFFSHLHSDHMMDYARLVHAAWDESGWNHKVFGPPPIKNITEQLFGAKGVFAHDLRARTELLPSQEIWKARGGTLPRPWPEPEVVEIEPGFKYQHGNWTLNSCEVPHLQPILVCMAFSIECGERKFVYSGDAGKCDELVALSRDADLLLHWCYRLDGEEFHPDMLDLAPTPSEIAEIANRANVKRLVLTHFRVHMDSENSHKEAIASVRKHFDGDAEIAEDFRTFAV